MAKNRILVLASTFPRWQHDSIPSFVLDFCAYLQSRRGYRMHALVPHYQDAKEREMLSGVGVTRFRYWPAAGENLTYEGAATSKIKKTPVYALKLLSFVAAMWLQTIRQARRQRVQAVNAHWLIPLGFVAVVAKFISRKPVVISVHGGDVFGLKGGIMTKFKRWTLQRADAVVVNSSATLEVTRAIYGGRDYPVIPMGIDISRFDSSHAKRRRGEPFTVIFVGRVSREKGLYYLCEAVKTLKTRGYNFRVLIAGAGPDEARIKRRVAKLQLEDAVTFLGWVPHEQLAGYYSQADVFVGPSIILDNGWQEAFGLVFAESLASGTPVIATNTGGISDVVLEGTNGYLVPQKDAAAIADKLQTLMDDPKLLRSMSRQSRQHIADNFSWEAVSARYDEVFKKVVHG